VISVTLALPRPWQVFQGGLRMPHIPSSPDPGCVQLPEGPCGRGLSARDCGIDEPWRASSETRERWERLIKALEDPDSKKNAELFVMPKGQQSRFEDPEVGVPFKEKIKAMLPAQP
jgi:hypothetical protein